MPSRSGQLDNDSASTSLLAAHHGEGTHHPHDHDPQHRRHRDSLSSTESSWTDTGDIGEQKGDSDADPVRLQLSHDIEDELLAGVNNRHRKTHKKVRIQDGDSPGRILSPYEAFDRETIAIPDIVLPPPSRTSRFFGFIMSGRSGAANGLTGKALL